MVWKTPVTFWFLGIIVLILIGFSFHETIRVMEHRWSNSEEYGYGYLIPIISIFLVWQRKNQLAEIEFHPSAGA